MLGLVGIQGLSVYRLAAPLYQVPVEPVLDLVPGITPFRVTGDVIVNSSLENSFRVTRKRMQDFTDATTHVQAELKTLQVDFTLSACGVTPSLPGLPGAPGSGLVRLARLDLIRYTFLERMAQRRRPVLALTPQFSLIGYIENLVPQWTNLDGWALNVSLSIVEARTVGPAMAEALPDVDALSTGSNSTGTAGSASGSTGFDYSSPLAPI